MAQLPPLISFTAGSPAVAGDVNQNFTDIRNHLNGANVDTENIATTLLSRSGGPILNLSQLTENQIAFNVENSQTNTAVSISQLALLATGKSILKLSETVAQTQGDAQLFLSLQSLSTIPAILVQHGGVDTFKLTKDTVKLPVKTTAQRNAISSPEEGSLLYNSTEKNIALYNGTSWVPPVKVDNSTLEYNANEAARIKDSGVTTAKIADLNVTKQKLQLLGEQQEVDTARSTGSITFVSTNYQLTITTIGRPVLICLTGEYFGGGNTSSGPVHEVQLQLKRDSTVLNVWSAKIGIGSGGNPEFRMPLSAIWFDKPAAGTYVYEFFYRQSSGGANANLGAAQFTVVEL